MTTFQVTRNYQTGAKRCHLKAVSMSKFYRRLLLFVFFEIIGHVRYALFYNCIEYQVVSLVGYLADIANFLLSAVITFLLHL